MVHTPPRVLADKFVFKSCARLFFISLTKQSGHVRLKM